MMKKLLLFAAVLLGSTSMFAQSIGIIGSSVPGGWDGPDINMTTTDNETYTLNDFVFTSGAVKFRQDDQWTIQWGGTTFPSGTATLNPGGGFDIPVQAGLYDVTFNRTTLEYSWVEAGNFDDVVLIGGAADIILSTINGVDYSYDNASFANAANTRFHINGNTTGWGSSAFPAGTATDGGAAIPVAANNYNISYNHTTHAYNFEFVRVGMIGEAVMGNWDNDVDMVTEDGVNYTLTYTFPGGGNGGKFRMNDLWAVSWGSGDFPSGTASTTVGTNIPITAGTYDVTFNRQSGVFAFTESTAGTKDFNSNTITVYPNPSNSAWNFNAGNNTISSMQIVDVTGKVVYSAAVNAGETTVNASAFASGMYFARLTSGNATETVRVVKN